MLSHLSVPEARSATNPESNWFAPSSHFVRGMWRRRVGRLLYHARLPTVILGQYCEPHFHYDPGFESLGPMTSLFGNFQSERYFGAITENLRASFSLREPPGDSAAVALGRIEASALPVSVHVRRGDYLKPGTNETHGILDASFYRQALDRLESMVGRDAEFFVFSDDPSAAEQVLSFVPCSRLTHVCGNPARPWEDMVLMARCRHHVIANSSFSWWGAWLDRAPDKIVIAPRAWFAPAGLAKKDTRDLCPPGWILV